MPYRPFHDLFNGVFRFPMRFSMVFVLPGMLFIGRVAATSERLRPHTRWIVAALILIFLADMRALRPLAIQRPPETYDFYETIGDDPDKYLVLEVPTAAGSGETTIGDPEAVKLQYYAIDHQKPVINAHVTRTPVAHYWYLRDEDPLLSWLGQRRFLEPEAVEIQLRQRINNWPIGYIVVHQDLIGRQAGANQEIIGYFNSLTDLLCPRWIERDAVVYETIWRAGAPCDGRTPTETRARNLYH